jgi:hypothetical protein
MNYSNEWVVKPLIDNAVLMAAKTNDQQNFPNNTLTDVDDKELMIRLRSTL